MAERRTKHARSVVPGRRTVALAAAAGQELDGSAAGQERRLQREHGETPVVPMSISKFSLDQIQEALGAWATQDESVMATPAVESCPAGATPMVLPRSVVSAVRAAGNVATVLTDQAAAPLLKARGISEGQYRHYQGLCAVPSDLTAARAQQVGVTGVAQDRITTDLEQILASIRNSPPELRIRALKSLRMLMTPRTEAQRAALTEAVKDLTTDFSQTQKKSDFAEYLADVMQNAHEYRQQELGDTVMQRFVSTLDEKVLQPALQLMSTLQAAKADREALNVIDRSLFTAGCIDDLSDDQQMALLGRTVPRSDEAALRSMFSAGGDGTLDPAQVAAELDRLQSTRLEAAREAEALVGEQLQASPLSEDRARAVQELQDVLRNPSSVVYPADSLQGSKPGQALTMMAMAQRLGASRRDRASARAVVNEMISGVILSTLALQTNQDVFSMRHIVNKRRYQEGAASMPFDTLYLIPEEGQAEILKLAFYGVNLMYPNPLPEGIPMNDALKANRHPREAWPATMTTTDDTDMQTRNTIIQNIRRYREEGHVRLVDEDDVKALMQGDLVLAASAGTGQGFAWAKPTLDAAGVTAVAAVLRMIGCVVQMPQITLVSTSMRSSAGALTAARYDVLVLCPSNDAELNIVGQLLTPGEHISLDTLRAAKSPPDTYVSMRQSDKLLMTDIGVGFDKGSMRVQVIVVPYFLQWQSDNMRQKVAISPQRREVLLEEARKSGELGEAARKKLIAMRYGTVPVGQFRPMLMAALWTRMHDILRARGQAQGARTEDLDNAEWRTLVLNKIIQSIGIPSEASRLAYNSDELRSLAGTYASFLNFIYTGARDNIIFTFSPGLWPIVENAVRARNRAAAMRGLQMLDQPVDEPAAGDLVMQLPAPIKMLVDRIGMSLKMDRTILAMDQGRRRGPVENVSSDAGRYLAVDVQP